MGFLDNIRAIAQERNMETRQVTLFFSFTLTARTVYNIHFWI